MPTLFCVIVQIIIYVKLSYLYFTKIHKKPPKIRRIAFVCQKIVVLLSSFKHVESSQSENKAC